MRDYAKVSPQFWIGATGKALRAAGIEAQVVAMYLMTNPHANMLGLYYVPTMYIAHETGMTLEGTCKGLQRASEAGFCEYDEASEVVWVHEMARFQIADNLKANDNRCKGVQAEYDALPENPYLAPFFERYGESFHMESCRGKGRGLQGALKPLRSQEQEQEQEQDQEQTSAPASPAPVVHDKPRPRPAAVTKPDDVSDQAWSDFLTLRKSKRAPLTATALAGLVHEAGKAGLSLQSAVELCCERGWQSLKAEWLAGGSLRQAPAAQASASPASATPHRKRLGEGSSTDYGIPGIGTPYAARAVS